MEQTTQPRALGGAQAVKAVMLASRDLRPNDRLVLIAIAAHSNTEGTAWPSVQTIADYSGVSPRTVHRVLAKLVQLGRLVVSKVAGIASNVYRLILDAVTPTGPGGSAIPAREVANPTRETANHSGTVAEEALEDQTKLKGRAVARDWRQWLKTKNPNPQQQPQRQPYPYPERRGAALPMPAGGDRCQRPGHVGQPAGRCVPCRSEALAGGR